MIYIPASLLQPGVSTQGDEHGHLQTQMRANANVYTRTCIVSYLTTYADARGCTQMNAGKTTSSVGADATPRRVWTQDICSRTFGMYYTTCTPQKLFSTYPIVTCSMDKLGGQRLGGMYYATTQAALCLCQVRRRGSLVSTVLLSQWCSVLLTVGPHAQRGLLYLVCVCVCLPIQAQWNIGSFTIEAWVLERYN